MCTVCRCYSFTAISFIIVDHTIIQVEHNRRSTGSVARCGEPVTNSLVYLDETTKPIIINCVGFSYYETAILLTMQLSVHHSVRLFCKCFLRIFLCSVQRNCEQIRNKKRKNVGQLKSAFSFQCGRFQRAECLAISANSANLSARLYRVEKTCQNHPSMLKDCVEGSIKMPDRGVLTVLIKCADGGMSSLSRTIQWGPYIVGCGTIPWAAKDCANE